jgi:regulator of protease activity HflC (stomatin/prohibitin superfamily)
MIVIVPSGEVGVPTMFGIYADTHLPEGETSLIAPWKSVTYQNVQLRNIDWDTGTGSELWGITADEIKLTVDLTVPFQIEPAAVPLMLQRLGENWDVKLRNWMRSAIYDTIGQFNWQSSSNKDRQAIAVAASKQINAKLTTNLDQFGLSEIEQAIRVGEVQIRAIYLPERIETQNENYANAEKQREIERKLTDAAEERAKRREKEGTGYANLINSLPSNVDAPMIAELLRAMADKQRAEAFMHLAKNPPKDGNIIMMMGEGGGATPMIDPTRMRTQSAPQVAGN